MRSAAGRTAAARSRSTGMPAAAPGHGRSSPRTSAQTPGIPSVMRPCHSWTQWDTAGPETSDQIRLHVYDLRQCQPGRPVPRITAPDSRSQALWFPHAADEAGPGPQLAHSNRERSTEPPPGHASDPASGLPVPRAVVAQSSKPAPRSNWATSCGCWRYQSGKMGLSKALSRCHRPLRMLAIDLPALPGAD
jgi:hypothetical protein